MAKIIVYSLLVLLVSLAVVLASNYNNKADEFGKKQIMKLLSLPQKSSAFPNLFKFKVGERIMVGSFKWSNCNASAPLKINSLTISPDPIRVTGDITLGFNGTAGVEVVAGLSAKLSIEKSVAGFKIPIPCVDNIGSCTYDNACSMIPPTPAAGCPPPLSTYKIPCACPFPKGAYDLPASTFAIPDVPLPGWLATGDYYATAQAYNKAGDNLACYKFEISLA